MEINTILKGYYYPSSRICKCPRFHMCTVTHKCQNYDQHNLECEVCEQRTDTHKIDPNSVPLGGHIAEGEIYPDIQDAIMQLQRMIQKPFAHPDTESQVMSANDIASKYHHDRKVTEMLRMFGSCGRLTMEEKIMQALVDESTSEYLGRLQ